MSYFAFRCLLFDKIQHPSPSTKGSAMRFYFLSSFLHFAFFFAGLGWKAEALPYSKTSPPIRVAEVLDLRSKRLNSFYID